jgi:hypothetical protein
MKKKKELALVLEMKLLQRIAEYYEFPVAVFFSNLDNFKKESRTRNEALFKIAEKYDKIKDIIEEE